jgi:glycosyltransferase involved in cell wall biosynthesis
MNAPALRSYQFSATYPESALLAIARSAAAAGRLGRFYTTLVGRPGIEAWAGRLPLAPVRAALGRELDRRRLDGIPRERVVTLAKGRDVVHRMATQLPAADRLVPTLEHRLKTDFDSRVSARVDGAPGDVIFAMEEAAELTIKAAHRGGMSVVLHIVNSHPADKNRYLAELGNLPISHPEMVPPTVVERIQRELAAADVVLVPSQMVAEQMVRSGLDSDKLRVLRYGVDASFFRPAPPPAVKTGPLTCLFVGQVCHRKGIAVLAEASRNLKHEGVRFLLAGPCRNRELLGNLPATATWLGPLPRAQVAELMGRADIFFLPTFEDACPLVSLEALASGLPQVITDHAGTADLVKDSGAGLVVPAGDAKALTAAVLRLAVDADLRSAMSQAAAQAALGLATWESYGAEALASVRPGEPLAQAGLKATAVSA